MRVDTAHTAGPLVDGWLEAACRRLESAGEDLARTIGEVNQRSEEAQAGKLGRRQRVTEAQFRQVAAACQAFHDVQVEIQNALFDCEHELRTLRELDVSPAELLIDGERLIRQYRFLRRRARIIDGLLAYLPMVGAHAQSCLEALREIRDGLEPAGPLTVPDCTFASIAREQLA